MDNLHFIETDSRSNYQVPLEWYPASSTDEVIVLLPAMSIAARFYRPLAQQLSKQGINVALFEQRGHGHSKIRASRACDYGFKEYLTEDIPAVIGWIKQQCPQSQLNLMGHSLGGHMASCYAGLNPENIDRVMLCACSLPHFSAYQGHKRWQVQLLYHLIPLSHTLLGYFAGHLFQFAGREARTLTNDWRHLIKNHHYVAKGIDGDIDQAIADYSGPVLSISFDSDPLSPNPGIVMLNDKWSSAQLSHHVLTTNDLSFTADHFKWARQPKVVSALIAQWLNHH